MSIFLPSSINTFPSKRLYLPKHTSPFSEGGINTGIVKPKSSGDVFVKFAGKKGKTGQVAISQQEKARIIELQRQVQERRDEMPYILQALFPLEGKVAGIKSMEKIESEISQNSRYKDILQGLNKAEEQQFLLQFSLIERLPKDPSPRLRVGMVRDVGNTSALKGRDALIEQTLKDPKRRGCLIEKMLSTRTEMSFRVSIARVACNISDPKLRDSFIEQLSEESTCGLRKEAAQAACNISDPKILVGVFERLSKDPDNDVRSRVAQAASNLSDPKFRDSLIERLSKDPNLQVRKSAALAARKVCTDRINQFTAAWPYMDLLGKAVSRYGIHTDIPDHVLLKTIHTIATIGEDGGSLKTLLQDFETVVNHAILHRKQFKVQDQELMNEQDMKQYMSNHSASLLVALILVGKDGVLNKFNQKQIKFEDFLHAVDDVSYHENLVRLLHHLCNSGRTLKDFKLQSQDKVRLLENANNFVKADKIPDLSELLTKMHQNGTVDLSILTKKYMGILASICGMTEEKIDTLPPERFSLWNKDYIHTIPIGLKKLSHENQEYLKGLVRATFQGTYWDYIQNPDTAVGRANAQTKKAFSQEKLNYDAWLHYDKTESFKQNGKDYEISLWKRNPGHDLFMGHYGNGCISMAGGKTQGIVDALLYTATQFAEIKDKASGDTVAYARCFWGINPKTNKPCFVIDNIHYKLNANGKDPKKNELIKPVDHFMKNYAHVVASKPVQTYLATACDLKPKDQKVEYLPLQVVGSTIDNTYYLNSLNHHDWSNITGKVQASVYKL